MKRIWHSFVEWFRDQQKAAIMYVEYDLNSDTLIARDWCSQKIHPFSGKFTSEKWKELKEYCCDRTKLYIWAGMDSKHLAYGEPIENYLNNEKLLKTGQGFHFHSGVKYGEAKELKCKCCGVDLINNKK